MGKLRANYKSEKWAWWVHAGYFVSEPTMYSAHTQWVNRGSPPVFVMEHEKLRHNTNSFWGPEMVLFVYTLSRWGVESSCEGLPDSNIGSSYQPVPTTDSSALDCHVHVGKTKRVLSPVTHSPSPPLLPTCRQPVHPYGGVIGVGR